VSWVDALLLICLERKRSVTLSICGIVLRAAPSTPAAELVATNQLFSDIPAMPLFLIPWLFFRTAWLFFLVDSEIFSSFVGNHCPMRSLQFSVGDVEQVLLNFDANKDSRRDEICAALFSSLLDFKKIAHGLRFSSKMETLFRNTNSQNEGRDTIWPIIVAFQFSLLSLNLI
jgi:hypothetical protein